MIEVCNECVGCTSMGLPCIGSTCPNRNVVRYYCDECGEEISDPYDLYMVNGKHVCKECILDQYETVGDMEER